MQTTPYAPVHMCGLLRVVWFGEEGKVDSCVCILNTATLSRKSRYKETTKNKPN